MLIGMSACHDTTIQAYLGAHLHKVVYYTAISELQRVRGKQVTKQKCEKAV